jgi:hypothetical protein
MHGHAETCRLAGADVLQVRAMNSNPLLANCRQSTFSPLPFFKTELLGFLDLMGLTFIVTASLQSEEWAHRVDF